MLRFHYEHDHGVGAPPRSRSDHRGGPRRRRPGRGRQLTFIEDVPIYSAILTPIPVRCCRLAFPGRCVGLYAGCGAQKQSHIKDAQALET